MLMLSILPTHTATSFISRVRGIRPRRIKPRTGRIASAKPSRFTSTTLWFAQMTLLPLM